MKKRQFKLFSKALILFSALFGIIFTSVNTSGVFGIESTAICQGIANDENNNIAETKAQGNPVPRYRTLLKYDVNLGTSANTVDVVSTTGQGIKLNGVPLSNISNALVDYANGTKYIRIKIPQSYQDALKGNVFLEVEQGTVFEDKVLDSAKFILKNGKWTTFSTVNFEDLTWNDIGYNEPYVDKKGVLLRFDGNLSKLQSEKDGGIQATNLASTIGEHVFLGNIKISTLPGAFISYHSMNLLFIYADNMTSYRTLYIEKDTYALDALLPEVKLHYLNTTDKWSVTEKTYNKVSFSLIRWNEIGYNFYKNMSGVLLDFSANLSTVQAEFDGGIQAIDFSKSIGEHILLGGKKISSLPGAFVSYHSLNMLFIYADNMSSYRSLKIEAGTKFMDSELPELTLYYNTGTKWSTIKEPLEEINFSTIFWNNTGLDVHEGKNGLMLSFSKNLSLNTNEISGSIKNINYVNEEIGEKIKLDGISLKDISEAEIMYHGYSLLWIYAPRMESYKELTIESVEFLAYALPNLHFAFFDSEWAEVFKITSIIDGVERTDLFNKKNVVLLGDDFYSNLLNDNGLSSRLISFEVDNVTYYKGQTLSVNDDVTVVVTAVGFKTTCGASIRISDPSNIRFENKIDKNNYDYLVTKYGSSNIETGTYIVPEESLSLTTLENFVNDASKIEGTDYFKVVNNGFTNGITSSSDGYYKYYGALQGVSSTDYCKKYCGIGYVKITDGQLTHTLYGGDKLTSFSRSIYDVIRLAYNDYADGSFKRSELTNYLNGILSLKSGTQGIEIDNIVEGYSSPYSLSYDESTGFYTVSGNSKINTVLVNGEECNDGDIVKISGMPYKLNNFSVSTANTESVVTFKLSSIAEATSLVDFVVNFPSDREIRILQITDTQIIDSSQMRTSTRLGASAVEAYSRGKIDGCCFNHISELIEKENPDLILFTGDIVYGEFDDSGEIWKLMVNFMDSFDIPWAPIFGNHDNETNMGVDWQCDQLLAAKNCLFKKGSLNGNGNYSIGLVDETGMIRRVIYMFDSNGCIKGAGIAQDQIDWMKNTCNSIDNTYGVKIPSFVCAHIASLDFRTAYENKYGITDVSATFNLDDTGIDGDFGQKNEKASIFNTSLANDYKDANVDAVFVGHDHVNNYSILYDGIRYTYGTKTGTYDYYKSNMLGGTLIRADKNGKFDVAHTYINNSDVLKRESNLTTVTFLSDLHFDTADYSGFKCTKSEAKLRKIVNETQSSRFYVNLGDIANSEVKGISNFTRAMSTMHSLNLNVYNKKGLGYESGNKMIYNLLGNHEVAYAKKSVYKDYVPYVEGVGSAGVFKYEDMLFVAVDALFTRSGSDDPADIITCTEYMIPDNEIEYLTTEVANKINSNIHGIVWISHVALQDIDVTSKGKLLDALKSYGLPMTVFEGHTHIENYQTLIDSTTGKTYCEVYTLPAVVLESTYPYYNVTFKDGKVWCVDKHLKGTV